MFFFTMTNKKKGSVTPYILFEKDNSVTPYVLIDKYRQCYPLCLFHDGRKKTTELPLMFSNK